MALRDEIIDNKKSMKVLEDKMDRILNKLGQADPEEPEEEKKVGFVRPKPKDPREIKKSSPILPDVEAIKKESGDKVKEVKKESNK